MMLENQFQTHSQASTLASMLTLTLGVGMPLRWAPTYYLTKFSLKMHENDEYWTKGGGGQNVTL